MNVWLVVLSIGLAVAAVVTVGDGPPRHPAQQWAGRALSALALLVALLAIIGGST